ncbi:MAG: alpha/beta hydrolase [Flavobacteriaceae bacterium]|nr:alpha/beta hydrolase [Flavobacteriaceae bacterium]
MNKPFKDLAMGLAVHGISSIRYDKRTYTYQNDIKEIPIEKEVIDDVSNIIKCVACHPEFQRKDVYLIGHSLGGMLLPKITLLNPQVKGLVFMAANVSPLEDLFLKQYDYLFHLDGTLDEVEQKRLSQMKNQVRYLKDTLTISSTSDKLPFQIPSSCWLSLKNYNPTESVKKISVPMLFLQGEQDYQVTLEEFNS